MLLAVATTTGAVVMTDEDRIPDDAIHAGVPAADPTIDFNRDVRPILVARCFACHGPDSSTRERGLRLDLREGAVEPARPGRTPVVIPHDADGSLLLERITDQLDPMPPSGEPLTLGEIDILRRWIDAGAQYDGHWSWKSIVDPDPPKVEPRHEPAVRTEVDRFILARIEAAGLEPAGDATPARQVRRLAFDLTGLPPEPRTVEAFEADPSDEHWDELVEDHLESNAFGERWGRHWLDIVRYAETCGHEFDYPIREAWRYRDWVVRAFNQDLPYDRFLAEQVAGDLLDARPSPTDGTNESVIGTAFWYFHQAVHAPTDVTQDQSDRIANQLEVFGQGFVGLTVACARCHDHKFDAISTRDYHALSGYMQSMHQGFAYQDPHGRIAAAVKRIENSGDIDVPDETEHPEPPARLADYLMAAAAVDHDEIDPEMVRSTARDRGLEEPLLERWIDVLGRERWREADHPWRGWAVLGHDGGIADPAIRASVLPGRDLEVDRTAMVLEDFEADRPRFGWYPSGWAWTGSGNGITVQAEIASSGRFDPRLQGTLRSETFTLDHRFVHWRVRGDGGGARIRLVVEGMVMDEFSPLLFTGFRQDVASSGGWRHVVMDTRLQPGRRAHLELIDDGPGHLEVDAIWMSDRSDGRLEGQEIPEWIDAARGEDPRRLAAAFARAASSPDTDHTIRDPLREALVTTGLWGDTLDQADASRDQDQARRERRLEIAGDLPEPRRVLAAHEGSGVDQNIYLRGSHRTPGDVAIRSFITSISGEPETPPRDGSGRLDLVDAMFNSKNPFPARVMANRVWHHLFGRGLVATTDDFGGLGEVPSHPFLLDHLATRLRQEWSIKSLIRDVVRSSAYRRSTRPTPEIAEILDTIDPTGSLLAVAPTRRLQAEAIRDAMLATSGRLDRAVGGPSIPTHLTSFMNGRGRPGSSGPLDGGGRRSLYLEVRRNFAAPMLAAFDLPAPMTTVGRRNTSNVPAQSLVLMNDPFVHEMARSWGREIMTNEDLPDDRARIRSMWRRAFATVPGPLEIQATIDFLQSHDDREEAWTDVAHAIYNSKAFIHLD